MPVGGGPAFERDRPVSWCLLTGRNRPLVPRGDPQRLVFAKRSPARQVKGSRALGRRRELCERGSLACREPLTRALLPPQRERGGAGLPAGRQAIQNHAVLARRRLEVDG